MVWSGRTGRLAQTAAKSAGAIACALLLTGMQGRLNNFDDRLLATHNRERDAMSVPPLRWNADLARDAQTWADHLAATGQFRHSPNLPDRPLEGENIWGGTVDNFSPEAMVNLWIAEKSVFKPGVFPANSTTGEVGDVSHYTQLVWRATREIGCGLGRNAREEILVCRYSAPGNVIGRNPV